LAEHNRNVTKYRRLLAGLPADPPEPPSAPATTQKRSAKPASKRAGIRKSSIKHKFYSRHVHSKQQKAAAQ
jgi:hypothetical protein